MRFSFIMRYVMRIFLYYRMQFFLLAVSIFLLSLPACLWVFTQKHFELIFLDVSQISPSWRPQDFNVFFTFKAFLFSIILTCGICGFIAFVALGGQLIAERTRTFGIMMVLGATRKSIYFLLLSELIFFSLAVSFISGFLLFLSLIIFTGNTSIHLSIGEILRDCFFCGSLNSLLLALFLLFNLIVRISFYPSEKILRG